MRPGRKLSRMRCLWPHCYVLKPWRWMNTLPLGPTRTQFISSRLNSGVQSGLFNGRTLEEIGLLLLALLQVEIGLR